jgi:DNA-binding MarR family transcriptional regulator
MNPTPPCFYQPESLRAEQSVGYLMRRVGSSISQQIDRQLTEHDLTHAQWLPLYKLLKGQCQTLAEMSRDLQLDAGALSRALDKLEAKGLVHRVRSTVDRRVVQVALTEAGRRQAQVVPPVLSSVLNAHLKGFSEAEWHTLIDLLSRMVANGETLKDTPQEAA